MRGERYSKSRRKVCGNCSDAKARCDRRVGGCTRCVIRNLLCTYIGTPELSPEMPSNMGNKTIESQLKINDNLLTIHKPESLTRSNTASLFESRHPNERGDVGANFSSTMPGGAQTAVPAPKSVTHSVEDSQTLQFSNLELLCPIDADSICNRWLNPYVPTEGQQLKQYPPGITCFIRGMLKSYTTSAIHGRSVPPFVHSVQMKSAPPWPLLSTCLNIIRICERPLPGSESAAVEVIRREMNSIYQQHETYDSLNLLAAFQAYLIYSMTLFFTFSLESSSFLRQAIVNLGDLAAWSCRQGLVCLAEQRRTRPRWEEWVVVESKRRTLFTMYLFDSLLSTEDDLPTFLGIELRGLPAPASKSLWEPSEKQAWEMAYNIHLVDWAEENFRIDELWPISPLLDQFMHLKIRQRRDQWLENVDEFGTMLYAVTSCTHGT